MCLTKGAWRGGGRNGLEQEKAFRGQEREAGPLALHCLQAWRQGGGTGHQLGPSSQKSTPNRKTQSHAHTQEQVQGLRDRRSHRLAMTEWSAPLGPKGQGQGRAPGTQETGAEPPGEEWPSGQSTASRGLAWGEQGETPLPPPTHRPLQAARGQREGCLKSYTQISLLGGSRVDRELAGHLELALPATASCFPASSQVLLHLLPGFCRNCLPWPRAASWGLPCCGACLP